MAAYLGLDLSKTSTGYALWDDRLPLPEIGEWELGCALTDLGTVCARLHQNMAKLYAATPFEAVWWEKPLGGREQKSDHQLAIAHGLAAHAMSFCAAKGIRKAQEANISLWRQHWLRGFPAGTDTSDLKRLAIMRCRMIGLKPLTHDAAEACGVLSYGLDLANIVAPWRDEHLFGLQGAA